MLASVVGTLRYPHQAELSSFLYEIKYRAVPEKDQVTLIDARMVRSKLFMLDDDARATEPAMMELNYDIDSRAAIEGGQWFLDALATNCGVWQDVAECIHGASLREAKSILEDRRDAYFATLREGGAV